MSIEYRSTFKPLSFDRRRRLLQLGGVGAAAFLPSFVLASDYGRSKGFPTGWGPRDNLLTLGATQTTLSATFLEELKNSFPTG